MHSVMLDPYFTSSSYLKVVNWFQLLGQGLSFVHSTNVWEIELCVCVYIHKNFFWNGVKNWNYFPCQLQSLEKTNKKEIKSHKFLNQRSRISYGAYGIWCIEFVAFSRCILGNWLIYSMDMNMTWSQLTFWESNSSNLVFQYHNQEEALDILSQFQFSQPLIFKLKDISPSGVSHFVHQIAVRLL
jgi:hypothetical protein